MDFALKLAPKREGHVDLLCFNPCFDGFCSKTFGATNRRRGHASVSILVLMDFALKLERLRDGEIFDPSFNPCFDGFCSKTWFEDGYQWNTISFNPCFDGFCSKTSSTRLACPSLTCVSILVLMDFALKHVSEGLSKLAEWCFNPCFDGFCSKTMPEFVSKPRQRNVSILVLMDFALKLAGKERRRFKDILFQSLF